MARMSKKKNQKLNEAAGREKEQLCKDKSARDGIYTHTLKSRLCSCIHTETEKQSMQPLIHITTITIQAAGGLSRPERRSEAKVRAKVARLLRGLSVVLCRRDDARGEERAQARRQPVSRLNSYMPSYRSKDEPPTRCRWRDIRV